MQDLKQRVAIITGAARGIGAACAKVLAEHGAAVVIADINLAGAQETAKLFASQGYTAMAVEVDVMQKESIEQMVAATLEKFGKIDILVNNAGINNATPIPDMTLEEWDRLIDLDLRGVHLCSQAVLKTMMANRYGKIVNIASLAGQVGGLKVSPDYSAAKAGVICLAKSYARFGGQYGITANAVAPGFIETEMTRGRGDDPSSVPLKRLGTPEDVANAVYFLASPLSDYVTGHTIDVNGGLLMR
ncbi:SDR family oxidoreductase [candidate division KSB3 bacterium]|uniref:SDR family oxidoreductase n=1 Tax=candidate division KSB3 bacterium TaxID=2044937 RepID=A0A9D5JSV8_9BACT|nr:SDR family oxidoreductase [candidate division KSB3 bacterium]MBD3323585.1 SDR family oxidoreductase [candidate division KSB3 bacterium]